LELDQQVDVAVGPVAALRHRPEEREAADVPPAAERGQRFAVGEKIDCHRDRLLDHCKKAWRAGGDGSANTWEARVRLPSRWRFDRWMRWSDRDGKLQAGSLLICAPLRSLADPTATMGN